MLKRFQHLLLGVSSTLLVFPLASLLAPSPSFAAERVSLRYGPFQRSVSIADLREYAINQKASPELESLLSIVGEKQRQSLVDGLKFKAPLNVVAVDKLLNSPGGEKLLQQFSGLILRRDNAGVQAMRGALVLSSASKEGLGTLTVLEAYPGDTLEIDLRATAKLLQESGGFQGLLGGALKPQ
jgi:hypothetical protein